MNLPIRTVQLAANCILAAAGLALLTSPGFSQCQLDEVVQLLPSDGAASDFFGLPLAINGTTAIVGASGNDDNGSGSGSAYLFDITTGLQITKLLPSDGAAGDGFGNSVRISDATAILGAPRDDDNGSSSGSAYLFGAVTGLELAKLLPDDGASGDSFGWSVAIDGTTAIVGAHGDDDNGSGSGSAYLFDTVTGMQLAKLLTSDGVPGDNFGWSVAISSATAIVGARRGDDNGTDSGSAYLFDTVTGLELTKLLPTDGATNDDFGYSVAISGTTAIVGARFDDDNGTDSGSAYLFDTVTGMQLAKLLPNDGAADDNFGHSVEISGTTAIVGARLDDDNGTNSGSAYLFDTVTGLQLAKLVPSDGAAGDNFGYSVATNGTTAIAGAWLDDDNGSASGSAYLFREEDCDANLVPDSCQIAADPLLDLNGNGVLDSCEPGDFLSFCNGDGGDQMGCNDCPCTNNSVPGTFGGCLNSAGTSTRIEGTGDASVSLPFGATTDLRFTLDGAPANVLCVMLSGDAIAPLNAANMCFGLSSGIQFHDRDGLRCAVMNLKRHGGRSANAMGEVMDSSGPSRVWGGEAQPNGGLAVQGGFGMGQTRYFQVTHRDNSLLGCMRGLNTSQAVEVTFTP